VAVCALALPPPRAAHLPAVCCACLCPGSASACCLPACRVAFAVGAPLRIRVPPAVVFPRLCPGYASACCPHARRCVAFAVGARASPACPHSVLRLFNTQHRTPIHHTTCSPPCAHCCPPVCRCGDARLAVCALAPPPHAAHLPAVLPLLLAPRLPCLSQLHAGPLQHTTRDPDSHHNPLAPIVRTSGRRRLPLVLAFWWSEAEKMVETLRKWYVLHPPYDIALCC
jgi:hypothetical protein